MGPGWNEIGARVGFSNAVLEHIKPVLNGQGFACTEATPCIVRFESAHVLVGLFYDRYDIDVSFALKADPSQEYTLPDMLDLVEGPGRKGYFQSSEPAGVVASLRVIAELLQKHGQSVLAGESAAYQRMEKLSRLRHEAYTRRIVQADIRKDAEEAWHRHDYIRVRDLYESIAADLAPSEKKKLEYAKKRLRR
jgi:hypothetical protein